MQARQGLIGLAKVRCDGVGRVPVLVDDHRVARVVALEPQREGRASGHFDDYGGGGGRLMEAEERSGCPALKVVEMRCAAQHGHGVVLRSEHGGESNSALDLCKVRIACPKRPLCAAICPNGPRRSMPGTH